MPRSRSIDDATLLDRALEVFWTHGYAATSMRDLTRATGLGAAALYHRYADKDALFVEAIRRYADRGLGERLARLAGAVDPRDAIGGFFDDLIASAAADTRRRGCLLVNTALDGAALSPAARALVRWRLGELRKFFETQLRRAQGSGLIGESVEPTSAAEALFGTVLAIRVLARLDPDKRRLRRIADHALRELRPARLATAGARTA
jgi:TetR/AcrR family transcriptional regulator, transcriptional repressor for nem operon